MASPSWAAGVVAKYPMNEPSGTVMNDTAGTAQDGRVQGNTNVGAAPNAPGSAPTSYGFTVGSQVVVPDEAALDPNGQNFSIEVWVNPNRTIPAGLTSLNIIQKGLSGDSGGNWKAELDPRDNTALCTFDDSDGSTGSVRVRSAAKVQRAAWSKIRCVRSGDRFSVQVNSSTPVATTAPFGQIDNTAPISVGAKKLGDEDTFRGYIDRITYSIG